MILDKLYIQKREMSQTNWQVLNCPNVYMYSSMLQRTVCLKHHSEKYGSGTNHMGGFVGGALFANGLGGFFLMIYICLS